MKRLTVQQRAERYAKREFETNTYILDEPPASGYPLFARIAWRDGYRAGQRDRQHKTAQVRRECFEHLARVTERQGRDVVRLASEVQRLRAKLADRTGSAT